MENIRKGKRLWFICVVLFQDKSPTYMTLPKTTPAQSTFPEDAAIKGTNRLNNHDTIICHIPGTHFTPGWAMFTNA